MVRSATHLVNFLLYRKKVTRIIWQKDRKNYFINDISLCIKNINPPGRYSDFFLKPLVGLEFSL